MRHRFNFDTEKIEAVLDHTNYIFDQLKLTFIEKKFILEWLEIDSTYDIGGKAIDNVFKNVLHVDLMDVLKQEREQKTDEPKPIYG